MLSVTNLARQTEPLNQIQRFEMVEEVNGAFTVSLTSFLIANNPAHNLIEEESIITIDDYEFRIKQMKESLNRKDVTAISTFYDLTGHRQESIYGGTRTFNEFATFVFGGTGWTFTSDVSGSMLIPNFGEDNVIKLTQGLCQVYECEYQILPNKRIHFADKIGSDNDAQYRYGHNVQALYKSVDTTNLRTQIVGYGGGGLKITYTSPNAEKYGAIEAEPIHDDKFTISADLLEHIKRELKDYPEVTIELDSVEFTQKELGERVWLVYEPMGIEFQTRIMAKKSVMRNGQLVTASATIGNVVPRNMSDILASQKVEIDENAKQTRSRFEQTNTKIELAVERFDGEFLEAYSKIEMTADEIRSEVAANNVIIEDGIAQNKSLISQTATQIRSEVSTSVTRLDGRVDTANSSISQLSGQISLKADSSTVSNLGTRVNSAEININGLNSTITSKVSYTDYNGNTIVSMINQTPSYIEINASKINLVGAVTVLSDISGNLGTITSGNINIHQDAYIGSSLYLRGGSQFTGIYFGSTQIMQDTTGYLNIGSRVNIGNFTQFNGSVDFSRATVTGLGGSGSTTVRYSASSKRLYIDENGYQVGYVSVT